MIRPPTWQASAMNSATAPLSSGASSQPARFATWNATLSSASAESPNATRTFGQLRPTTTSRVTTNASAGRYRQSTTAPSGLPAVTGSNSRTRPAAHSPTNPSSGNPDTGKRPVQYGPAD